MSQLILATTIQIFDYIELLRIGKEVVLLSVLLILVHRLGGLSSKPVFLRVLDDGKCRVQVLCLTLVSGEVWLPGLWIGDFLLYSDMTGKREQGREKGMCVHIYNILW